MLLSTLTDEQAQAAAEYSGMPSEGFRLNGPNTACGKTG